MSQVIGKKLRLMNVPTATEQENVQQLVITPEGKVRKKVIEQGNIPPIDLRTYKVYTAFLDGTNSIASSVLDNTLGFVPIWGLVDQGMYEIANWDNSLNWSKTTMEAHCSINNNVSVKVDMQDVNIPRIIAYPSDQPLTLLNQLQRVKVEIRVYNLETTDS